MANLLCLGIKKIKFFCSALDFSYLWLRRTYYALGKVQINLAFLSFLRNFGFAELTMHSEKFK